MAISHHEQCQPSRHEPCWTVLGRSLLPKKLLVEEYLYYISFVDYISSIYEGVCDFSVPCFSASLHVFLSNGFSSTHCIQKKRVELWEHLKRWSTNSSFLWSYCKVEFVGQSLWSNPKYRHKRVWMICSTIVLAYFSNPSAFHWWSSPMTSVLQTSKPSATGPADRTCVYGAYIHQQYPFILFIRIISRFRSNNSILRMQLRESSC
jgi:hypothetical protein